MCFSGLVNFARTVTFVKLYLIRKGVLYISRELVILETLQYLTVGGMRNTQSGSFSVLSILQYKRILQNSVLLGYDTVSMGNWIPKFRGNVVSQYFRTYGTLMMRILRCIERSGSDYPQTLRHVPEERNPQLRN
jgi:hypothetical protein